MLIAPIYVVILAAVTAVPAPLPSAPAPQDTPLREIVRVKSSGACDVLDRIVSPVAAVAQHNDREFGEMRTVIEKFAAGKGAGSGGTAEHNTFTHGDGAETPGLETHSALVHDPLAFGDEDNGSTYTPERTMAASNIDRLSGQIQHNLDAADKAMKDSWKAHPDRSDPAINALRQRVQNIIDLQRVLAARLDEIAGLYFSNKYVSGLQPKNEQANFESLLDQMVDAQAAEEKAAQSAQPQTGLTDIPFGNVDEAKHGSAGDVAVALRIQEVGLSLEAPRAARSCAAATPIPTPSP